MFHVADHWLMRRLQASVPSKQVRSGWPSAGNAKKSALFVQLIQVRPLGSTSTARRLPLVFSLDYLLIPSGGTTAHRHELLGKAATIVAEDSSLRFSSDPLPAELHATAQGWVPYLRVNTQWHADRPAAEVPPVTEVELSATPHSDVSGVLIGPGGKPLAHEPVAIPALGRHTTSGPDGRIRFPALPHKPGRTLTLQLRGRSWAVRPGKQPFTLHVTPKEP